MSVHPNDGMLIMSSGSKKSHVFYRDLTRTLPQIVRGEGVYLYDNHNNKYLDASGGAIVVNVGHGVEEIADAIAAQAKTIAYVNGLQFTNEPVEALAGEIASVMPEPLSRVYFLTSGAEATEAAIKLARQYWVEKGLERKYQVISHTPGYHGGTLGALMVSGRPSAKRFYHPLMHDFPLIPAPVCYRCPLDKTYPACGVSCAHELEKVIQRENPETVSAYIAEPIIGASAGAVAPPTEYFHIIRDICHRHQVLFIADEVLTGLGRTGSWLAIDHYDVLPDMVLLGKGLGGGYAPLSALVTREDIVQTIARGTGTFVHGLTFAHTPVMCTAGLATLLYLKAHGLVKRSAELGAYLSDRLQQLNELSFVGDIRCKGLLAGIEFVADRKTKRPYPRSCRLAEKISEHALTNGLVLWTNVGHVDGENGDLVMIGPPFTITRDQIDELIERLIETLKTVSDIL